MRRRTPFLPQIAVMIVALASAAAHAHAILIASTPAPNAHVKAGPLAIAFRYNSRIDAARSKLTLTGPAGAALRLALSPAPADDVLMATCPVTPGAYTLRWQVLAKDGHITRGGIPFMVDTP